MAGMRCSCSTATSAQPAQPNLQQLLDSWTALPMVRALVQLGVPDELSPDTSIPAADIAKIVSADPEMLRRAVRYVAGIGVFKEMPDGRIAHSETSLQLRKGGALRNKVLYRLSEEIVMPYVHGSLKILQDPSKSGFAHLNGIDYFTEWLPKHPESEALFGQYMSEATSAMMGLIEDAFPWPRSGVIADIGGGNGHLLRALLQKGAAQGVLFDLPSVIETSRQHWPDGDLMRGSSVTYMPGSFLEAVPVKADIYVLKWILHDWSDADCIRILSNLQASAPKESQVVVIDMLVPEDQPNQYHVAKFFDVHMAIGYGGKERTVAEMRSLAKASGFVMVEVLPVGRSPFACFVLKKSEAEL